MLKFAFRVAAVLVAACCAVGVAPADTIKYRPVDDWTFYNSGGESLAFTVMDASAYDPADVRTTTRFRPPTQFGLSSDSILPTGDPLIGLEVVAVRITWDVAVDDGHDAADIDAHVSLPIDTASGVGASFNLDGASLGWSGSGTFHHHEATDRFNGVFGPADVWFGWTAVFDSFDAAEVLSSSKIEIDYLVPEPSSAALLALAGLAIVRRRRRKGG